LPVETGLHWSDHEKAPGLPTVKALGCLFAEILPVERGLHWSDHEKALGLLTLKALGCFVWGNLAC